MDPPQRCDFDQGHDLKNSAARFSKIDLIQRGDFHQGHDLKNSAARFSNMDPAQGSGLDQGRDLTNSEVRCSKGTLPKEAMLTKDMLRNNACTERPLR